MLRFHFSTLILLSFFKLTLQAQQPLVGVNNSSFTIAPSYTVNNNTSITITGKAINAGTVVINGNVHVNMAIDTSLTSTPEYKWRKTVSYPVTNFLPNAIFNFTVTDVASNANGFKVNGGGTTVIVWCSVGTSNDTLSVKDTAVNTIYVLPDVQSIQELNLLQLELNSLVNPITEDITLKNTTNYQIELIDVNGKATVMQNSELKLHNLAKGLYVLKLKRENGNELIKKIIIE